VEALKIAARNPARDGESLFQHVPRAQSDHRPHLCFAQRRPRGEGERMIDRRSQVTRGIDQRTVKVEADDGKGKIGHRPAHGAMCWKPQ
jgi:hypothetical protein